MTPDIKQIILELETLNDDFEVPFFEISLAIKVCKMWKFARDSAKNYDMGQATKLQVHRILKDIEGRFFPSTPSQDFTVTIEGSRQRRDNAVQTIECVYGVKEVKQSDKE